MFHKIYNIVSALIFIVLGIILYFSNLLSPIYYLVAVVVYAFIYLLINAIRKESFKTLFLMPLIGALTAFGILNLTIMSVAGIDKLFIDNETASYVKEIKSTASSYKELFEYGDLLFYADREFENLIEISKSDDTYMMAYPIKQASEVSDDFSVFSPFYDISTTNNVEKTCNYAIHYAFLKDAHDKSILLRLVVDDSIYYTYVIPNDINEFIKDGIGFEFLTEQGSLNVYVSNVSASVDLKDVNSENTEIDAVKNATNILVTNGDSYYCGDAMYVEYEQAPDFVTRINSFYNRATLDQIEAYKKQLEEADEENKTVIEQEVESLSLTLQNYYVELVNEKIVTDQALKNYTVRFYRTYNPALITDEEPDFDTISIVEWYVDGTYLIGTTDFSSSYMISKTLYE